MTNQYLETILYHYILSDVQLTEKIKPSIFTREQLRVCYGRAKEYVLKHKQAPSAEEMKQIIRTTGYDQMIPDDIIDALYAQKGALAQYGDDWLRDNTMMIGEWRTLLSALENACAYVKLNEDKADSYQNVKQMIEEIKANFVSTCAIDFDEGDTGVDFWDPESHKQSKLVRSRTGYDYLDTCLKGGYFPGCLVVIVGPPKIGKSLWLQNLAAKSVSMGENTCYVSLELPEEMVTSRIGSNMFSIPANEYETLVNDSIYLRMRMDEYRRHLMVPPGALVVKSFPTSTMSVLDLENFLLKKEDELSAPEKPFKFKNVIIDYINIMREYRNENTDSTYLKIKRLAEDTKAIGIKHGWAMITATQTNRDGYDQTDMTAANVGESTGLGMTVDLMMGIIAPLDFRVSGLYDLKCIYDRVAPYGDTRKRFNLDKTYLRITEDTESKIVECTDYAPQQRHSYKGGQPASIMNPGGVTGASGQTAIPLESVPQGPAPTAEELHKGLFDARNLSMEGWG